MKIHYLMSVREDMACHSCLKCKSTRDKLLFWRVLAIGMIVATFVIVMLME